MMKMGSSLWVGIFCAGVMAASCGGSSTTIGDGGTDGSVGSDGNPTTNPDGSITGPACTSDAQCGFPTPYCDTAAQVCVQCLGDPNCANAPNNANFCSVSTHTCVQCNSNAQCGGGGQPYCSPAGRCVECLADGNCPTNEKCNLNTFRCAPACTSDQQCSTPTPYCNTTAGYCVQCLGNSNCADPQFPVCNTTTNQCVECLANTDCPDPQQPLCFLGNDRCVECLVNTDCGANGVCRLDHTCN